MDAVVSWILENWPVLGVIVVVAVIVWLISQYVAKLEASRRKMDSLPCESHKASIDKLAVMNTTVDAINDQVTEISKWIMRSDGSMIDPLTRKCSPRVMTSLGKQLFELSGAAKVLDENSELEKSARDDRSEGRERERLPDQDFLECHSQTYGYQAA